MNDLETLRPEVRDAINRQDRQEKCDEYCPMCEDRATIRAELLRLAGEVTELRAVCAATYQAAGCYGLPERFKDALSNAATGERIHDVDVDKLCPVDPVEWVERAEHAEAELAALKARIEGSPSAEVWGVQGVAGLEPSYTVRETPAVVVTPLLSGKRVRLIVEE